MVGVSDWVWVWLLQNAERMACVGLHGQGGHGRARLMSQSHAQDCGVRLWLVACHGAGEGRRGGEGSCQGLVG